MYFFFTWLYQVTIATWHTLTANVVSILTYYVYTMNRRWSIIQDNVTLGSRCHQRTYVWQDDTHVFDPPNSGYRTRNCRTLLAGGDRYTLLNVSFRAAVFNQHAPLVISSCLGLWRSVSRRKNIGFQQEAAERKPWNVVSILSSVR